MIIMIIIIIIQINIFSSCLSRIVQFIACAFIRIVISNCMSRIITCKDGLMKWPSVKQKGILEILR